MAHGDNPRMLCSILRRRGPFQILLQPTVLIGDLRETVLPPEVDLRGEANDVRQAEIVAVPQVLAVAILWH